MNGELKRVLLIFGLFASSALGGALTGLFLLYLGVKL